MRKTRMLAIAGAVAAVLAAGCSDDTDDASDTDESTTTTVEDDATQELRHDSIEPAAEFCDAISTRDGEQVVALMSDDAVAVDHSTGEVFVGPDEIRAWIDEFGGFDTFELTECGDEGVATNWWSTGTYRFYSDTNDGGTEGLGVVQVTDGEISRFDAIYTLATGETTVSDPISDEDRATATAFCEAWGTEDPEQILPLVSDDYVQQPAALVPADGTVTLRDPFPAGEAGVREAAGLLASDPMDTVECSEEMVSNGGWIGLAAQFVDTDDATGDWGGSWGGIMAIQIGDDGLVTTATHWMDLMDAEGNYVAPEDAPASVSTA